MKTLGELGEKYTARYLKKKGYRVLVRNYKALGCEVDLIARDPEGVIVFVEVKTRTSHDFGYPEESVGTLKIKHIERAAGEWLGAHKKYRGCAWRVDIVAITTGDPTEVLHFEGV